MANLVYAMKESRLAEFFRGEITAHDLAVDIQGSEEKADAVRRNIFIDEMPHQFDVTRGMAVELCDAVLSGDLKPECLRIIGFALITSDGFTWAEDDLLANIFHDWACPEVNYELSLANTERFKSWLEGRSECPASIGDANRDPGRFISQTTRVRR